MSDSDAELSMSKLSLHSENGSQSEDWDRSMSTDDSQPPSPGGKTRPTTTPRNSVIFPVEDEATPGRGSGTRGVETGKRSLSELMRLHAAKGTDCKFSAEEAKRVADDLRDWINSGSSPYEDEDDFFARGSQDDLSIHSKLSAPPPEGRPRGSSDSSNNPSSRPPSAAGSVKS
ncbi:hypothetical protein DFH07DRAFT_947675 [Mycena maculata]|uniref:HPr domain-containing protein n=1 Tax=Mycena maculata TaxID=230809 RepID=A0AAD7MG40_9AGAR|nr:hypothetical protein DFH07DRAFT_947675 [Mycena maculata]